MFFQPKGSSVTASVTVSPSLLRVPSGLKTLRARGETAARLVPPPRKVSVSGWVGGKFLLSVLTLRKKIVLFLHSVFPVYLVKFVFNVW